MLDDKLQRYVIEELRWEPGVDPAHIGVTAEKGVVTLIGHVGSLKEKHAAEQAARRVKGVLALADEIEVRLPASRKWHDDEIAQRAVQILHWACPGVADSVAVKVDHGIVTLDGTVKQQGDRVEVEADVRRLNGIVGIVNRLVVRSDVDPIDVENEITAAFERQADLDSAKIKVATSGDTAILSGVVRRAREREIAENAAWAAPGINVVQNYIVVEP